MKKFTLTSFSHFFLSCLLMQASLPLKALAVINDGKVNISYRTTMPIPGQTSGKVSWVQVDLETIIKDFNHSKQLACRSDILKSLETTEALLQAELNVRIEAKTQIQTISAQIKTLELSLPGLEPENQRVIVQRIALLKAQATEKSASLNKNIEGLLESVQYFQKLAHGDWPRLFDLVESLNGRELEFSNAVWSFRHRFQLSNSDFDYLKSKMSVYCTGEFGVRDSNGSVHPQLFPIEVKVRIPTRGLSPAQIRELRMDIISGNFGADFRGRAVGFWVKGTEMMDGTSKGLHVGGVEWTPEVYAATQTEMVFKIKASVDFGFLWRGSMGESYLNKVDPIVQGQAIQVLSQHNTQGKPLKQDKDGAALLNLPPGMTSSDAQGFYFGSILATKVGISARIWNALEFSLAYAFNYYDTHSGESNDYEGNFSVIEQSVDASVFLDLTQRTSIGVYSRYDRREMTAEHFVGDTQLSIPSENDIWAQVGGVIRVKW